MPSDCPVGTLDDIRLRLASLQLEAFKSRPDHEGLHSDEDQIWADVLEAIADGRVEPVEAARLALETREMDFCRWYA